MQRMISSKEDKSSILFKGRARVSEIEDIPGMDEAWRDRLAKAVEASGKSMREVSLAAGKGPGYLHSLIAEGKDPTVSNLMKVCEQIGVSLWAILYGAEMTAEDEELLRLYQGSSEKERESLLQLLRSRRAP